MATQYYATGRRKTASARVYLRPGKGKISVNNRSLEDYFGSGEAHQLIYEPLKVVDQMDRFDIIVTVRGGGKSGQADAISHGIARALINYSETDLPNHLGQGDGEVMALPCDNDMMILPFRRQLRLKTRLVTRDSRKVERKKVGRHKARKLHQYSKR